MKEPTIHMRYGIMDVPLEPLPPTETPTWVDMVTSNSTGMELMGMVTSMYAINEPTPFSPEPSPDCPISFEEVIQRTLDRNFRYHVIRLDDPQKVLGFPTIAAAEEWVNNHRMDGDFRVFYGKELEIKSSLVIEDMTV